MRQFLAFTLSLCLITNPLYASRAIAANLGNEYSAVCDPIDSGATNAQGASSGGDQAKGECAKAKMAMKAVRGERAKAAIITAAMVVVALQVAFEMVPYTSGMAKAICQYTSLGVSAGTMILDMTTNANNAEVVGAFAASASQVVNAAGTLASITGAGGGIGKMLGGSWVSTVGAGTKTASGVSQASQAAFEGATTPEAAVKGAEDASKEASEQASQNKASCVQSLVMLGIQDGLTIAGWTGASSVFKKSLENAKKISNAAHSSTTTLAFNGHNVSNGVKQNVKAQSGGSSADVDPCEAANGNAYLQCLGTMDPEVSAITNNPAFVNTMEKALGGKSLGDFAKGFTGETNQDVANYVGAALGFSPGAVAKIMDNSEKVAKATGALDKYVPLAYARNVSSVSSGDAAPDFSKLMSGMLKQLDPGAEKTGGNPADLVFRQLDLLPPEKIEQSKDISLFARIGYRYRKNLNNLEQLNWSKSENQESARK